ncbi:hypothetical protein Cs7R123_44870 [Catellatospora sp. TT07R-123]|uniref:AAA family ATPase n=1 Tax=Catellatospora sp. TT07R-123 TaxID=2733863 RepID=UPI001B221A24|nr:AAA family ATPase [Catellatospora sp. TT07R-123]GHJ47145.1 hypothetical protein Cs7R123_44870 [Catellatospora sp. TT07R-123]
MSSALVERLAEWRLPGGDPLLVVHGPAVDDVFVGHDLVVRSFQEVLWEYLAAEGFKRIVFSSVRDPVYFRDPASRASSRRQQERPRARSGLMGSGFSGPMGNRVVVNQSGGDAAAAPAPAPADLGMPPPPRMALTDEHGLLMLDHLMRQSQVRTAVVLTHAEESLRYTEAGRTMAHMVADWLEHAAAEGNLCVFVFRHDSLDQVRDFLRDLRRVPRLETYVDDLARRPGAAGAVVGFPEEHELGRLVQVARLRDGLRVGDWPGLGAAAQAMASRQARARDWRAWLRQLTASGAPFSGAELRARGLVAGALSDGRSAWDRLAEMPGLASVKSHLEAKRWRLAAEAGLREAGRGGAGEVESLHLVFTGNPGTGKTTVARLVGEMYRELGLLRRGHVVEVLPVDLVAGYVGQSAQQTNRKIDEALDGVLFIDEAYGLTERTDDFGKQVIDTLLARMENERHRLVVIAAGYPEQMERFVTANPGLTSRFRTTIHFPDYAADELLAILLARLGDAGLRWTDEFAAEVAKAVTGLSDAKQPRFGNARAMRDLADDVKTAWAGRIRGDVTQPLTPADIPERYRFFLPSPLPVATDLFAELDGMVGLAAVRQSLQALADRTQLRRRRGLDRLVPPSMLFLGSPGTGKTTVARTVGQLLRSLGLLRRGHVVEVTRQDLVAGYVGQTATRTLEVIERAMDGVLFIDEAYSLVRGGENDFGREAIDTLTAEMERHRDRLTVIAAGYPAPMEAFLAGNVGLRSRFTERVVFPDLREDELLEVLRRLAAAERYTLGPDVERRALAWLGAQRATRPAEFGNARVVKSLFAKMEARLAGRLAAQPPEPGALVAFDSTDVPDARG